jgi:D-alanyl-D-alanine dipeptidase
MNQINYVLPKSKWQDIVINESNEILVDIIETDKLKLHKNISLKIREKVYSMLIEASLLLPNNLNLVVIEGFRSLEIQKKYWDETFKYFQTEYLNESFESIDNRTALVVARPLPLANHKCGGAVDVYIVNNDGNVMDMGTEIIAVKDGYKKTMMFSSEITEEHIKNRAILREAMTKVGFVYYPGEWWHYCYGDRMWAVYQDKKECFYGPVGNKMLPTEIGE